MRAPLIWRWGRAHITQLGGNMSAADSLPSHDAILTWLGEYISSHWATIKRPISGPRAHNALVEKFGKFRYQEFGTERFKDFLRPGDGKNFRMVIEGTRHFLYPINVDPVDVESKFAATARANYLKPE